MSKSQDMEDILNESLALLGGEPVIDNDVVEYGSLSLRIAPKEGKANTLLADHLFSPALFLAEKIERGLLPVQGRTVVELGAGSGLPSLLMATMKDHPSLVVVSDYPDDRILGNLKNNVDKNRAHFQAGCRVECYGHAWGTDPYGILNFLPPDAQGYDVIILSDLLHFYDSHDDLIASVDLLLSKAKSSLAYISAGNYTHPSVCDNFLLKGENIGLVFEEVHTGPEEARWMGEMNISGLDQQSLSLRKAACRYWIGRWAE